MANDRYFLSSFNRLMQARASSPHWMPFRRPLNHTTYWLQVLDKRAIEYLRHLAPYNYLLVVKGETDIFQVIIQYKYQVILDPSNSSIVSMREAPLRANFDHVTRALKTDNEIIEEGGVVDYELIDKLFDKKEAMRTARSTSPL